MSPGQPESRSGPTDTEQDGRLRTALGSIATPPAGAARVGAAPAGIGDAAPVFAALGDETRLRLVVRLGTEGPLSIARLTSGSAVTRQAVTKHLTVLAGAGLVHDVHSGRQRIWALDRDRLAEAQGYLEYVSRQWDDTLARLKAFVEE